MAFKPKLIAFDEQGYNNELQRAESKLNLIKQARAEALKHISEISDLEAFCKDIITYTKQVIISEATHLKKLNLSLEKVLYLLEINLDKLESIQLEYEANTSSIIFDDDGNPKADISKEPYCKWTKNQTENEKLIALQNVIISLEDLKKHCKVYYGNVSAVTSNAIVGDLRTNSLKINSYLF